MKFGIFGDIHGNLEGLEAVLKDMEKQGVTHPVCIGDIVGYGANPNECLQHVQNMNCPVIKGNHDEEASDTGDLKDFNPVAAAAMVWTREQLDTTQKDYLRELPYTMHISNFTVVHASLDSPEQWSYVFNKLEASSNFTYQMTPICFYGHTHVPTIFIRDQKMTGGFYSKIRIQTRRKYFINVSSAGQPRDGDWRCGYVIYSPEDETVELRRLEYDIVSAQKKIIQNGLPRRLAERLAVGK